MSIKLMSLAWEMDIPSTEKMVLLCLCDYADENGRSCYPAISTLAKHRLWAFQATKAARPVVPATGDIPISVEFYPPDNRSDRINFWNRMKPYFDGIAEAMGVNDKRFLPAGYHVCEPIKGGRVVVTL